MPRGRQYYNPLTQAPDTVQGETDYSRIELFPAGQESLGRLPQEQGKWVGRRIAADGSVAEEAPGDFDHDSALRQATELWPGLMVYELNAENEDSTWDGIGPSPRIWQNSVNAVSDIAKREYDEDPGATMAEVARLADALAHPPAVNEPDVGAGMSAGVYAQIRAHRNAAEATPSAEELKEALSADPALMEQLKSLNLDEEAEKVFLEGVYGLSQSIKRGEQTTKDVIDEALQWGKDESVMFRVLNLPDPGTYVLLDDVRSLLETYANAYELDKNPSAALALRDAVDALKDIG